MPNHVHLLLTPSTAQACGLLMKHIGQLQTQYMNRTYKRSGALWEGRYRSSLVQSDRYLLTCYRYIELNPVRAGLAADPGQYFWSSYRTNAMGVPSSFITPHEEYVHLGTTDAERRRAYTDLVAIGVEESALHDIRQAANSGEALGDRGFRQGLSRVRPGSVPDRV
jgi:putative transposase